LEFSDRYDEAVANYIAMEAAAKVAGNRAAARDARGALARLNSPSRGSNLG